MVYEGSRDILNYVFLRIGFEQEHDENKLDARKPVVIKYLTFFNKVWLTPVSWCSYNPFMSAYYVGDS